MKTLKIGNRGSEVERLHNLLSMEYKFDEETKKKVIEFQKANSLIADGIVGYNTWQKLILKNHKSDNILLNSSDYKTVSELLDIEIASLKAIQEVETGGRGGFFKEGYPSILFEGHIFWRELEKRGIDPELHIKGNEDILYSKWTRKYYKGGIKEYARLEKAREINKEAADSSASWGMFQIMGFNYQSCGVSSLEEFIKYMHKDEFSQLVLTSNFLHKTKLYKFLQTKEWDKFAKGYNGPAYKENKYDIKLEKAYTKHKG